MKTILLSQVAQWTGGELHIGDATIKSISTDSRVLLPGSLYIALRGEHFDGHDFAAEAAARGATGLLVETDLTSLGIPQVRVADTLLGLRAIAMQTQATRHGRVVAVTGSNGKTTVKMFTLAILQLAGLAYINPGNRNNEVGLPLAVIDSPEDADYFIYEMGAAKPGDIEYLTEMVRPDVALVNNIAAAHLERLGSLLGVAHVKEAVYSALPADGVAVINADEPFALWFEQRLNRLHPAVRVLRFGLDTSADVTARGIRDNDSGVEFILVTPQGEIDVRLPLVGRHNVRNALAAATVGVAFAVPLTVIAEGLRTAQAVAGRQTQHWLRDGVEIIDDSYNANPGSVAAAIEVLAARPGERWLVLGDMLELGDAAVTLHAAAGQRAKAAGISRLYALGPLSAAAAAAFGADARHFEHHAALAEALRSDLNARPAFDGSLEQGLTLLVKGSRGSAMEKVVIALRAQGGRTDVV